MNSHVLVCDFKEDLISRFQNQNFVVRVERLDLIPHLMKVVQEKNHLYAVWLHREVLLCNLSLTELEEAIAAPLYLEITGLGNFRDSIEHIRLLRRLKGLVLLSEDVPGSYRDLKILSSLLVPCGIKFGCQDPVWDSLSDLMSYFVYSKVPHAPIQPFHFVTSNYNPQKRIDFNFIYFEDPAKFLHLDVRGWIALSRKDLEREEFISTDLSQLDRIEDLPSYGQRLESWREFFLKPDGCAYCPGWRICLGKFEESADKESGCKQFFSEWMEATEYYQEQKVSSEVTHPIW
jgi:hypothetical protein